MTLFLIIVAVVVIGLVVWYLSKGKNKGPKLPTSPTTPTSPPPPPETPAM